MARVTRRKLLEVSGGMAGILATGQAPALAQTTTVHWLKWNDFVPAGDQILRQSMLAEAEKALGFKINMETIGLNDLQPRATAAIQAQRRIYVAALNASETCRNPCSTSDPVPDHRCAVSRFNCTPGSDSRTRW